MSTGRVLRVFTTYSKNSAILPRRLGFNGSVLPQLTRTTPTLIKCVFPMQQWPQALSTVSNNPNEVVEIVLDNVTYERVCGETLDALCDYFEELLENASNLTNSDVTYGDGVLTINFGKDYGTYVINRQTPNKQIWLSSPTSGPKRYDFVGTKTADQGRWIYKHTGESMHELLQREIQLIFKNNAVDFLHLPYSG